MLLGIIAAAIVVMIPLLLCMYSFWKADRLPPNNPRVLLSTAEGKLQRPIVVFAGDSLTHGNVGVGFVDFVYKHFQDKEITFVNAGINGDLAWNLLQRIDEIIACDPDVVMILIGTNDALFELPIRYLEFSQRKKKLPQKPTREWYEECLRSIVLTLKERTSTTIMLASLPPIGEGQVHHANSIARSYCQIIESVAHQMNLQYVPLNESLSDYLGRSAASPRYPLSDAVKRMILAMVSHYVFRTSWDDIAVSAGLEVHIDHIHLNSTGARICANQIIEQLNHILQ